MKNLTFPLSPQLNVRWPGNKRRRKTLRSTRSPPAFIPAQHHSSSIPSFRLLYLLSAFCLYIRLKPICHMPSFLSKKLPNQVQCFLHCVHTHLISNGFNELRENIHTETALTCVIKNITNTSVHISQTPLTCHKWSRLRIYIKVL